MSLDRIFSELQSRSFRVRINGKNIDLPHLNTMKPAIYDAYMNPENINGDTLIKVLFAWELFRASGSPAFIRELDTLSKKDAMKIFDAWWEWSGVDLGKYLGALGAVGKYPNALEMDLFTVSMTLKDFFNASLRQQVALIINFSRDPSSNLYAEVAGFEYRWGVIEEILALQAENFVAANSDKKSKEWKIPRPKPDESKTARQYTPEQQKRIQAKLGDLF